MSLLETFVAGLSDFRHEGFAGTSYHHHGNPSRSSTTYQTSQRYQDHLSNSRAYAALTPKATGPLSLASNTR